MLQREIPALTGIRGVAALWVVMFHLATATHLPFTVWLRAIPFADQGWRAVDLFFVLSGFILMHVHQRDFLSIDRDRTLGFYWKRFLRVYPLNASILVLLIPLIVVAPSLVTYVRQVDPNAYSAAGFVQRLFLASRWGLPNFGEWNGVTWSLSAEIIGYALFPIICFGVMKMQKAALAALLAAIACAFILLSIRFGFGSDNVTSRIGVLRMLPEFCAGMIAYRLRTLSTAEVSGKLLAYAGSAALLIAMAVPGLGSAVPMAFTAIIAGSSYQKNLAVTFLSNRMVMFLGITSFALYLTHQPLVDLAQSQLAGVSVFPMALSLLITMVAALILVAVGAAAHYLIEAPMQKLFRRRRPQGLVSAQ